MTSAGRLGSIACSIVANHHQYMPWEHKLERIELYTNWMHRARQKCNLNYCLSAINLLSIRSINAENRSRRVCNRFHKNVSLSIWVRDLVRSLERKFESGLRTSMPKLIAHHTIQFTARSIRLPFISKPWSQFSGRATC